MAGNAWNDESSSALALCFKRSKTATFDSWFLKFVSDKSERSYKHSSVLRVLQARSYLKRVPLINMIKAAFAPHRSDTSCRAVAVLVPIAYCQKFTESDGGSPA